MSEGTKTSEFKFGMVLFVLGTALEAVGAALATLHEALPHVAWLGVGLAVIGALKQVAAFLGYSKARAMVKSEQVFAARNEAHDAADEIRTLKDAVEELKARVGPQQ